MEIQIHIHRSNAYSIPENCVGGLYYYMQLGIFLHLFWKNFWVSDWSDT